MICILVGSGVFLLLVELMECFSRDYFKDDDDDDEEFIDLVKCIEFFFDSLDVFLIEWRVDDVFVLFEEGEVLVV